MGLVVQIEYLNRFSAQLRNFKRKDAELWNFSCPVCGDSQKNEFKARGYVYRAKDILVYKCHNCGVSYPFSRLLEQFDSGLYQQYLLDCGIRTRRFNETQEEEPEPKKKVERLDLPSIADLDAKHVARKYVVSRKIPMEHWEGIYFSENFRDVAIEFDDEKYKRIREDARIVFPVYSPNGMILGVQGRAIDPKNELRYVIAKIPGQRPFMFGLDRWKPSQLTYVIEGPIDSLFLPNAIAAMSSTLQHKWEKMIEHYGITPKQTIFIFDNQPRNPEIVKLLVNAAKKYRIFLWPDGLAGKDVNDLILAGMTREEIKDMIDANAFQGPELLARVMMWRKC